MIIYLTLTSASVFLVALHMSFLRTMAKPWGTITTASMAVCLADLWWYAVMVKDQCVCT